ncbi:hypothetical protein [Glutamicibacter sp. FBE19]|uniref:hypothetical protein n=1 Tax=Glutamicibacter sp. FBE19 TaxID=2761534 RepID=UPI0019D599B7|nr:hypothetical protein [Glutamicibacter sp. FBE19]MBF6671178.1 hypothetical protein [Glutamicibacter sp. FBE19]
MKRTIADLLKDNWKLLLAISLFIAFMVFFPESVFRWKPPLHPPVWDSGFSVVGAVSS